MATPAQVANDMAAQAAYWTGRDREVARTCLEAAQVIRDLLEKKQVDVVTLHGLAGRLLVVQCKADTQRWAQGGGAFARARTTLLELESARLPQ